MRNSVLSALALSAFTLTGCPAGDEGKPESRDDTGGTVTERDMSSHRDMSKQKPDTSTSTTPDAGLTPDDGTDPPDEGGTPDLGVPDVPASPPSSVVCEGETSSITTGQRQHRIRVRSDANRVYVGYLLPSQGALVQSAPWGSFDTDDFWPTIFDWSGNLADWMQLLDDNGEATSVVVGRDGPAPHLLVTRREATECAYVEYPGYNSAIDCGSPDATTWGGEITNTQGVARYFWFSSGGMISSMPVNDVGQGGGQILVPWCAPDPQSPGDCLEHNFRSTDSKASAGPHVLISDSAGRAYLWDTVQNIDGSAEEIDCTTPPTAPVLLTLQGEPLNFTDADIVWVDGANVVVHQTAEAVRLHRVTADLQLMPAHEELPNTGLRPMFDAVVGEDGRIAAANAINDSARLFAFGDGGGTLDITIGGDDPIDAHDIGVAVNGDRLVLIAAVTYANPAYVNTASGFTMWQ